MAEQKNCITWTIALEANAYQVAAIENTTGKSVRYVEMSDTGGWAGHESGPSIMAELARLKGGAPLRWEDLSDAERRNAVMAAAESFSWQQGDLDPYRADELLEQEPRLAQMMAEQATPLGAERLEMRDRGMTEGILAGYLPIGLKVEFGLLDQTHAVLDSTIDDLTRYAHVVGKRCYYSVDAQGRVASIERSKF